MRSCSANVLVVETTIPGFCCVNHFEVRSTHLAILKRLGMCEAVSYSDRILEGLLACPAKVDHERMPKALAGCAINRSEFAQKLKVLLTLRHRAVVFY